MDPDLAHRLRRFGEQVDQAAIAATSQRTTTADPDHTDVLPIVVPIAAARNRRLQMITAAAAAAIVVVGGAVVAWRLVGESDPGPADSTQATESTTTTTTTTSPVTTTVVTTTLPAIPPGGPSTSTSTSTTSSSTTSNPSSTGSSGNPPATTVACPNGYEPYGNAYPIRMCDEGPAVSLIQQRVSTIPPDGFFGRATRQSVIVFQQLNGLNADGLVGPMTWAAMFPNGAPGTDADGNGTVEPWEVS